MGRAGRGGPDPRTGPGRGPGVRARGDGGGGPQPPPAPASRQALSRAGVHLCLSVCGYGGKMGFAVCVGGFVFASWMGRLAAAVALAHQQHRCPEVRAIPRASDASLAPRCTPEPGPLTPGRGLVALSRPQGRAQTRANMGQIGRAAAVQGDPTADHAKSGYNNVQQSTPISTRLAKPSRPGSWDAMRPTGC